MPKLTGHDNDTHTTHVALTAEATEEALQAADHGSMGSHGDERHEGTAVTMVITWRCSAASSGGACCSPCLWWSPARWSWTGSVTNSTSPASNGSDPCSALRCSCGAASRSSAADYKSRDRQPGMMLLIAMAITVAYVASMATSLGAFDLDFWWELGALISIMLLGHWQEMKALGQAQDALSALAALLPDEAERITDDRTIETIPADRLRIDDTVLVRSGGRVPADGEIVDGAAELDESMITGESRPVPKAAGDAVVAGTVSTDSAIRVRVTAVGDDTTLAGIGRLVAEAQESRSRSQVLADKAAALLFYVAVGAAIVTAVAWMAIGNADEAVVRAVTVLVISCPHASGSPSRSRRRCPVRSAPATASW